jgi:hypothetical protein
VGLSKHARPQSISLKLPTLRFRARIMLGFAVVLAISAVSMGIAYLGFERVSAGVEAAANIVQVNRGATETGSASADVLNSARTLSTESTRLREELDRFMSNIRAA